MNTLMTLVLTMILASCGQQPVGEVRTAGSIARVANKAGKALDEMLAAFKKLPELKGRGIDVDETTLPLLKKDSDLVIETVGDTKVAFLKGYSPREQVIRFIEDGNFDVVRNEEKRIYFIADLIEKDLAITSGRVQIPDQQSTYYLELLDGFIEDVGYRTFFKKDDELISHVIVEADDYLRIPDDVLQTLQNNDVMVLVKRKVETE